MILIFVVDDKFMNGMCRLKKIFSFFFDLVLWYYLKLNYFMKLNYFKNVYLDIYLNNCM